MLISCPECGTEVSEKAPTCPKCGAVIAYPTFYTVVERDGLNIDSLLCDWWNELPADSAFGSGRPIQCLVGHSDDEEMAELTWTNGKALVEAMEKRVAQLPRQSLEANELKLTADYVRVSYQFANLIRRYFHSERRWSRDTARSELDSILPRLETIKASCKIDKDMKLISSEIEECKQFAGKILTERSTPPIAPPPIPSQKSSGCLSLLIILIALTAALSYAAIALGN